MPHAGTCHLLYLLHEEGTRCCGWSDWDTNELEGVALDDGVGGQRRAVDRLATAGEDLGLPFAHSQAELSERLLRHIEEGEEMVNVLPRCLAVVGVPGRDDVDGVESEQEPVLPPEQARAAR